VKFGRQVGTARTLGASEMNRHIAQLHVRDLRLIEKQKEL